MAVVAILGANRIYDLIPALDWESHVAQLEALAETTLLCIGRDVFSEELKTTRKWLRTCYGRSPPTSEKLKGDW